MTGFMLRSLIHLNLSFVQGDIYASICILLHAEMQLFQQHLLKMLPFLGIYPKDAQPYHKDTCLNMFTAALFIIAELGSNLDAPQLKNK